MYSNAPTQPHHRRRNSRSAERSSRERSASPKQSRDRLQPPRSIQSVHGRNSIPACDRCRSFKKKCSRTFPKCSLCASAGRKCSYGAIPSTPEAELLQLRARVQWFSAYINNHLLNSSSRTGIEEVETGSDLVSLLGSRLNSSLSDSISLQSPEGRMTLSSSDLLQTQLEDGLLASHSDSSNIGTGPRILGDSNDVAPPIGLDNAVSFQTPLDAHDPATGGIFTDRSLSEEAAARKFVDAYFQNANRAYPLVNQTKILENLQQLSDHAQSLRDSQSTLLYLVMSIGCNTLERAGQVPRNTAKRFEVAHAEIIQECVCRDSVESVQILMLLALYSLFDPKGASVYSIVGIAARQAITIGLTRRLSDEGSYSMAETELRHRLYWSIFALDRMMAASQGLPLALEENSDVPFPGLTVEEFASPERTKYAGKLQTSRHVIQLRSLEGRILDQVHFRKESEIAEIAPIDRRAILGRLRASIEDWYSQGCLLSPMGSDDSTIHSSTTWLSARYYWLLLLLYYPNHFNRSAMAVSRSDLLQFVQRHVQATTVLFQQKQLPLNCNTLYRLMPLCLVMMHEFLETFRSVNLNAQLTFSFTAKDEVAMLLSVFEAFPQEWNVAHEASQIMHGFVDIISGGMTSFLSDENGFAMGATRNGSNPVDSDRVSGGIEDGKDDISGLMGPCIYRFTALMQAMMGKSTSFQFIEYPTEDMAKNSNSSGTVPHPRHLRQEYHPQLRLHEQQSGPVVMGQLNANLDELNEIQQPGAEDDVLNYGWGAIDMDFL